MPAYLYRVSYTSQTWASQIKSPKDRLKAIRPIVEGHGGKVVCQYYAFGEDDLILIAEMPDNVAAAAFALAAAAGGALTKLTTTPLMSMEEGMKAMRGAKRSSYQPPK